MSIHELREGYVSAQDFEARAQNPDDPTDGCYLYADEDTAVVFLRTELARRSSKPRLLDVGCGFGRWAHHLRDLYDSYVGIDPSATRIQRGQVWLAEDNIHQAQLLHRPEPGWRIGEMTHSFDVCTCVTVIQHLSVPQAVALLQDIAVHLRSGGVLLAYEGCIIEGDEAEAERQYETRPRHMIPKPVSLLQAAIPGCQWEHDGIYNVVTMP